MAEIDSLEISIQSNIDKVNKNLDTLISKMGVVVKGISAIGNNKGLEEFAKNTKTVSESMGNMGAKISQSMKPAEAQIKKTAKTLEQIVKEANAKTMNLTPQLNMGNLDAEYKKYENQLRNMQNQLNKVLAMPSAEKQGRTIERLVANINEAKNALSKIDQFKIDIKTEGTEKTQKSIENFVEEFQQRFKNISPSLDFQHIERELEKYKKQFRNAQDELIYMMENPPEIVGTKELKNLERIVQRYNEANNAIKELQDRQVKEWQAPEISDIYIPEISSELTDKLRDYFGEWKKSPIPEVLLAADKSIDTTREKIEELQQMFAESGKDFAFSGNSEQLDQEIQKVKSELDSLYKKQDKAIELGKIDTEPFRALIRDIENAINRLGILESAKPEALNRTLEENAEKARSAANQLKQFEANLQQLRVPPVQEDNIIKLQNALKKTEADLEKLRVKLANGLTLGKITQDIDDSGYRNLREQIALTEKQADALREKIGNVGVFERLKQSMSGLSASSKTLNKAFSSLYAMLKKLNSGINSVLAKIGKFAKSMFSLGESAKSSGKGFNLNLKTILKYGFGIRSVYMLVNKLRNAIKEGMKNLVQYSAETNASVSMLVSSLATLKNASAAAASPLVNAIAPALNQLIQLFIRATNAVNQFLSALMGRSTWIKAKDQIIDYADSISDASKAAKGALQPFDKLNNLTSQQAAGGGIDPSDMFETLPIESKFKDLADKIKDILRKLFAPLKEAWNRQGKFVMKAWKYALDEVWKLIKDIGRDFLKVWQQEKTIKIFEDILKIIGYIGLTIGKLAEKFREAWNENETGLHILENIRDIIGVVIEKIREIAALTYLWAMGLDFSPLLTKIEEWTESLIPVFENLAGIIRDFYAEVLLPLSKWTLEEGLPKLLDVFIKFNEKVNWEALRENLSEFWKHLEPFAETVGEGLIIFIQRVSDALADFLNSQEFKDFLVMIEDWMDSVTPEDVADALEKIAKALIVLKLAVLGFGAISAVTGVLKTLVTFFSSIGTLGGMVISGAKLIVGGIGSILSAIGSIPAVLAMVAAAVAGWKIGEWINTNLLGVDTPSFHEMMDGIKSSFTDGSWREALRLWGEDIKSAWTEIWGYVKEDFNNSIIGSVLGSFKDGSWKEALRIWGADIKSAWSEIWEYVKEKAHEAIEKVKGFLKFDWSLPKIKLPHFKISGKFSLTPPSVPSIGVDWYAKGGIFDQAQVIGVGEAGREAVLPLTDSKAMKMIADGIMSQYQGTGTAEASGYQLNGQGDPELKKLLRKNNELLEAILEKPTLTDKDIFDSVGKQYGEKARRNGYSRDPVFS